MLQISLSGPDLVTASTNPSGSKSGKTRGVSPALLSLLQTVPQAPVATSGCAPPDVAFELGCLTPKIVVSESGASRVWGCPPGSEPYNSTHCLRTTPVTRTCPDGSVVPASSSCPPVPAPPAPTVTPDVPDVPPVFQEPAFQDPAASGGFEPAAASLFARVPRWAWWLGGFSAVLGTALVIRSRR